MSAATTSRTRVSPCHRSTFTAESTMITIVPDFNYSRSIPVTSSRRCAKLPPFTAGMPCEVPLWTAKLLRERRLAQIQIPDWLESTALVDILQYERTNESFATQLPFHYYEIAGLLRAVLPKASMLLVQDICGIRLDKLRTQFHGMSRGILQEFDPQDGDFPIIAVAGIASIELWMLGPFLKQAMGDYHALTKVRKDEVVGDDGGDARGDFEKDAEAGSFDSDDQGSIGGDGTHDQQPAAPAGRSRLRANRLRVNRR